MGCLGDNTILAFAQARLGPALLGDVEAHARACDRCHDLLRLSLNLSGGSQTAATEDFRELSPRDVGQAPIPTGTSLGRYTVLDLIGRGGMGEVYSAYDRALGRRVALKVMNAQGMAQDETGQHRLVREGQALAKLSHPNVVIVHDVGELKGRVFVAMEFVEGVTLARWLAEKPRPWREVVDVFVSAARGLSAAHQAGFVHRDFKPLNVMIANDGAVRVTDFGLARRVGEAAARDHLLPTDRLPDEAAGTEVTLTRTGERVGTPRYMAPEQFTGRTADARSDQFSFCVALYIALYGVHPFDDRSMAVLVANAKEARPATSPGKSPVPLWVERAVMRGLVAAPSDRWPSMDALVAALLQDPGRRQRRRLASAGALAAVAAFALLATTAARKSAPLCQSGQSHLTGVWELTGGPGSRRDAVRAAVAHAGGPDASRTWTNVSTLLDRHVTKWLASYGDACEATHVRGEQSEDVLDLRMAGLSDDLDSTRVLTSLLAEGDPRVVEHAMQATGALDDLSRCSNVAQLRSGVAPPKDPRIRAEVASLRSRLKEGSALFDVGRFDDAAKVADAVLSRADSLGYCPVKAEALCLKGNALTSERVKGAPEFLEEAVAVAESCGHDRVVAEAAANLVFSYATSDPKAGDRSASLASAALSRIGGDARLQGWLLNNVAMLRLGEGRLDDAEAEAARALKVKEERLGSDHPDVAITTENSALVKYYLGDFRGALALSDQSFVIFDHWLPKTSELWANFFDNRGYYLLGLGHLEQAKASFEEARAVCEAHPLSAEEADVLEGLGRISLARGQAATALAYLERVLRMTSQELPVAVAEARLFLARALVATHRDPARAIALAQQALDYYAPIPALAWRRREAESTLAELKARRSQPIIVGSVAGSETRSLR